MRVEQTLNGYVVRAVAKNEATALADFLCSKNIPVTEVKFTLWSSAMICISNRKELTKKLIKTIVEIWKNKSTNEPTAD